MIDNQRLIYVSLAGFYCLCLGVFALFQNPKSKVNQLFAIYNFFNALWNAGDFVVLFNNLTAASWFLKITSIGSSFLVISFMHFTYEFLGISRKTFPSLILKIFYAASFFFCGASFFHLVSKVAFFEEIGYQIIKEVPGPLFIFFAAYFLVGMVFTAMPLLFLLPRAKGIYRRQISYLLLAWIFGVAALLIYFPSLYTPYMPLAYHFQALVGFIFAYAIFKHDLIPVTLAFRRASLILGIYIVMGGILVPMSYFYLQQFRHMGELDLFAFVGFIMLIGVLFSLGPLVYAFMVRRSAIFQDETTQHITHEFKSPLGAIQNAQEIVEAELKKVRPDSAKIDEYLGMIHRNRQRLEKFVTEILDFAKIGEGVKSAIEIASVDLRLLAGEVISLVPQLKERIRFDGEGPIIVQGSPEGLRLILTNLLSNAEKYAPEGPIRLEIKQSSKHIEILVEDEGKGIEQVDLERIFEPFVRGKAGEKGSGLGLAIAKKWVQFHGGKIWAESEGLGKGAKFTAVIPI